MKTKSMFKCFLFMCAMLTSSLSFGLIANSGQNMTIYENEDFKAGFSLQAAYLSGRTLETVYDVDYSSTRVSRKISELSWSLDDVILAGGSLSFEFYNKINLNIGMWDKVDSSNGTIDDEDYLAYILWIQDNGDGTYSESEIENLTTHYSKSDTELKKGQIIDINAAYTFYKMQGDWVTSFFPNKSLNSSLTVQGLAGYKKDEWKWDATGGYYLYNMYSSYFAMGQFDDVLALTYENEITIPYIGLNAILQNDNKSLNVYALWSKWAEVDAVDHHPLRNMVTHDSFDDADYWGLGINLKWDFANNWSICGAYEWEEIKQIRGDAVYQWFDTSSEGYLFPAAAGFEHKNETFSLSVAYKFL